jgi:hypothetical protein
MLLFDETFKWQLAQIRDAEPEAVCIDLANRHLARFDFLHKVLTLDVPTAQSALNSLNPNADGPTIFPASGGFLGPKSSVSFGNHPPSGAILRYEIGRDLGATPNVSADSPAMSNDVSLHFSFSSPEPVFVKARYFAANDNPVSAQSFATYRAPLDAVLIQIIRDSAAASDSDFSKWAAVLLTMFLLPKFRNSPENRAALVAALEYRHHNLVYALTTQSAAAYDSLPPATKPPPVVASVVSRFNHGDAGVFDLPLSTSKVVIEPRRSSAGFYQIIFTFNTVVTSGTARVVSGTAAIDDVDDETGIIFNNDNTMTVLLRDVADKQIVTLAVYNVAGPNSSPLPSDGVQIGFLQGDIDQDGAVTGYPGGPDLFRVMGNRIRSTDSEPARRANFLSDVNADGDIELADERIVRNKSGNSVFLPVGPFGASVQVNGEVWPWGLFTFGPGNSQGVYLGPTPTGVNWAFVAGTPPDPITGVILPQIRWLYDDPYTIDPQTGFDDVGAQDIYNIGLSGDDSWVIAEAAHLDKWGDPRELIRNPLTSFTGGGRTLVF